MTLMVACGLIAALFTILSKIPVLVAMRRQGIRYNNRLPRNQQTQFEGLTARALAAHQNSYESLIIFGLALSIVISLNAINPITKTLAAVHIIARFVYHLLYLYDYPMWRSIIWTVATGASFWMITYVLVILD